MEYCLLLSCKVALKYILWPKTFIPIYKKFVICAPKYVLKNVALFITDKNWKQPIDHQQRINKLACSHNEILHCSKYEGATATQSSRE